MALLCLSGGYQMTVGIHPIFESLSHETQLFLQKKIRETQSSQHQELAEKIQGLNPFKTRYVDLSGPEVIIGDPNELSPEDQLLLQEILASFKPWKKGPFRLFGTPIDAEWRSDWKWDRVKAHCPSLEGKVIADIGAHNGYYMFRMAHEKPKLVLGFEPYTKHWLCFDLLQNFAQIPELQFTPLGVEHIHEFPKFFDIVFCMGILYHHTDPIKLLCKMRDSLKKGGTLIVECQGIDSEEPVALVPKSTYAGSGGTWFLPSLPCLMNWLHRSGFRNIHCFHKDKLSEQEQRSTEWAPIKSLKDFLHPDDPEKTIENYPRPWRFYLTAKK